MPVVAAGAAFLAGEQSRAGKRRPAETKVLGQRVDALQRQVHRAVAAGVGHALEYSAVFAVVMVIVTAFGFWYR